jgi:hypothetical protein
MNKEFIPYTEALALKELGFDEDCFAIWSGFDELNFSITDTIRLYSSGFRINGTQSSKFYINDFNSLRVAAPTFSQAFRWFREKYDLHHVIHQFTFKKGTDEEYLAEVGKADDTFSECRTYEDAEVACLEKLIEIIEEKQK